MAPSKVSATGWRVSLYVATASLITFVNLWLQWRLGTARREIRELQRIIEQDSIVDCAMVCPCPLCETRQTIVSSAHGGRQ